MADEEGKMTRRLLEKRGRQTLRRS